MAFVRSGFRGIGGYNRGFVGGQRYSYVDADSTTGDTLAVIKASAYFDLVANALGVNDLIDLVGTDGAETVRVVTADTTNGVSVKTLGAEGLVSAGAATLTLTAAVHAGITVINDQTAGLAITMAESTGSGAIYRIINGAVSATANTITCAGADVFDGNITVGLSLAQTALFHSDGADTIITQNLTTSGLGDIGDWVEIQDILSGTFAVRGQFSASGVVITPFS